MFPANFDTLIHQNCMQNADEMQKKENVILDNFVFGQLFSKNRPGHPGSPISNIFPNDRFISASTISFVINVF